MFHPGVMSSPLSAGVRLAFCISSYLRSFYSMSIILVKMVRLIFASVNKSGSASLAGSISVQIPHSMLMPSHRHSCRFTFWIGTTEHVPAKNDCDFSPLFFFCHFFFASTSRIYCSVSMSLNTHFLLSASQLKRCIFISEKNSPKR